MLTLNFCNCLVEGALTMSNPLSCKVMNRKTKTQQN